MTATHSMGAAEGNSLAIIEAHARKYGAHMSSTLGSIRKTAIGRTASAVVIVRTTEGEGNLGSAHQFNSLAASKGPDVSIGKLRMVLFDNMKHVVHN